MRIIYLQIRNLKPVDDFAEACLSLTPKVYLLSLPPYPHEIFLDISSTQKYFGGEKPILSRLENLRASFEIEAKIALVDRPEWARALAKADIYLPAGKSREALLRLPVDRLFYCGDPRVVEKESAERATLIAFMKRVGLKTIADFAQLSATAINRRFGKLGISLHQWIKEENQLCLAPFHPSERLYEWLEAEEIGSLDTLLFYLRQVFVRMEARLQGRSRLAKEIKFTFHLESGEEKIKLLTLAEPFKEAQSFLKLLKDYLNQTIWDSPLQSCEVEITDTIPFQASQLSLFNKTENSFADLAQYVERLRGKLGNHSVGFADLQESYLPERSCKASWPPPKKPKETLSVAGRVRPPVLYSPPRPQSPQRNWRLTPSENLATEWWEAGGYRRYFIAQTPHGDRLWMFWDCQKQEWFVQGTFD